MGVIRSDFGGNRVQRRMLFITTGLLVAAAGAQAHHSGSMFDQTRQITVSGTVREFQWTNPHSWIQLTTTEADGSAAEWSIEMAGPPALYRQGWRQGTLKPGDKISVVINPVRDGSKAGNFVSASRPDGSVVGAKAADSAPPATQAAAPAAAEGTK